MLWPFPDRDQDPWWDAFVDFIRSLDSSGFAAREDRNLILQGGGDLSWDAAGPGLTWSEDFTILSPSTGFYSRIVANTLAPNDGQVIRAEITRAPGQNVNVAATVANIADNTDNSLVLGVRLGDTFVFRNGLRILDGTNISAEEFFQGGGAGEGVRKRAVINIVDCTAAPPTEVTGDRYILDFTGGSVHADWDGAAKGDIVEFDGTVWDAESPEEGWVAYVDVPDKDAVYVDDGVPAWELRTIGGDVVGPGSATDHALARFDTATGKLIQNSVGILDDSGNLSGIGNLLAGGYHELDDISAPGAPAAGKGRLYSKSGGGLFWHHEGASEVDLTAGGGGDVVGPGSSTDHAIARFDLATGKLIQNSVGILDDSGNLSGINNLLQSGYAEYSLMGTPPLPAPGKVRLFCGGFSATDQLLFQRPVGTLAITVPGSGSATFLNALDTTSSIADNRLIRGDTSIGHTNNKGVQGSGVTLDDSDNLSGVNNLLMGGYQELDDISAPGAPGAGKGRLYTKAAGGLFWHHAGGSEIDLTAGGGGGDVVGPGSSTDHAIARFDLATGKLIQNSVGILDDSGNLSGIVNLIQTGYQEFADIAAPGAPGAGKGRLYKKTGNDGLFWMPDAAGPEVDLTTGGGGGFDIDNDIQTTTAPAAVLGSYATATDNVGIDIFGNIVARDSTGRVMKWTFSLLGRRGSGAATAEVLDLEVLNGPQHSDPSPVWSIDAIDNGSGTIQIRAVPSEAVTIDWSIEAYVQES
jgi:hypothetical protein